MAVKNSDGYGPEDFLVVENENKPSTWHLQVKRNGKPDHQLMGASWAALTDPNGFRGNVYEGPNKQEAVDALTKLYHAEKMLTPDEQEKQGKAKMSADPVYFDATFAEDPMDLGEMVVRSGKMFEVGDFPDKHFSATPEDLDTMIDGFQPVDLNLQHTPTILQGKLGKIISVFKGPDGKSLYGQAAIPRWLHAVHGEDQPLPISVEIDRLTKKLLGGGLVYNPRVPDAKLVAAFSDAHPDVLPPDEAATVILSLVDEFSQPLKDALAAAQVASGTTQTPAPAASGTAAATAAQKEALQTLEALLGTIDFARNDTAEGQQALQKLHDVASDAGASCDPTKKGDGADGDTATMAATHETNAIQAIHDMAHAHGAACKTPSGGKTGQFSLDNPSGGGAGIATPNTQTSATQPRRSRSMKNALSSWIFNQAKDADVEVPREVQEAVEATFSGDITDAQQAAIRAEAEAAANARLAEQRRLMEEMQTRLSRTAAFAEQMERERRHDQAVLFAQAAIDGHRVPPGVAPELSALIERVMEQDSTINFADGQPTTLALLKTVIEKLPDMALFTTDAVLNQVHDKDTVALFARTETPGAKGRDEEEVRPEFLQRVLESTPDGRAILAEKASANGHGA